MKSLKAITLALAAALSFGCGTAAESQGFDWPRWRGPDANGISKETGWNPMALAEGPRVLWKANVGLGYSNVSIKAGRLYTLGCLGSINAVWCLNAETGKKIWQYSFDSIQDPQSTPTAEGDSVYILSKEGILLCLNAQNGKLRWKKELVAEYGALKPAYGFAGSPVVEGNLLILNVNTAGMALQKETGSLVWISDKPPKEMTFGTTDGTDYMTPVVYSHEGKRYALFSSWKGISSVDVQTGTPLWVYAWERYTGDMVPDPVIMGDTIYLVNEYGLLMSKPPYVNKHSVLLEIRSGQPTVRWKSADLQSDICSPVVLDGYIYSGHGGPFSDSAYALLRCLELETGRLMWEAYPAGRIFGKDPVSLMAADGKLIILTDRGILAIAEATHVGYKEISRCDLHTAVRISKIWYMPPVLCNGRIYCRDWAGELICLDVSR